MTRFSPRHSVIFLFIAALVALVSLRWYQGRQLNPEAPQPSPSPAVAEPLSVLCQTDADCGSGFFCREGECSEYLYDTACTNDSDCQLVNTDYGYGCCSAGACQPKNLAEDSWIAVNAHTFSNSRSEFCPSEEACGPAPLCPEQSLDEGWAAECQESECVKTRRESLNE